MIWRLLRLLPVSATTWIPLLLLAVAVFAVGYARGRTAGDEEWTPVVEDLRRTAESLRGRLAQADKQLFALREAGEAGNAICAEALRQSFLIPEVAALPVAPAPAEDFPAVGSPAGEGDGGDPAPLAAPPPSDRKFTEFLNAF